MITLIGSVVVKDGMMEEALTVVKELVQEVRKSESGTIKYTAYTSDKEGNENKIFWYETYDDEEALKLHRSNLAAYGERFGRIFDMSKNTITICDPII
ncbi:MAG: hypothetical protein HeimC2_25290 [Candidatus Heimdallarchaeota archaeon LC_2]|nr:MAG: hypothetical protein HeimC2_25290 [Candidatus Heimdallarchaeota archaeon LC_2]